MLLATPTNIVKGKRSGMAALDNICFGRVFFRVSSGQVFCSYPKATFSPNLPNKNLSCFFHGSFELVQSYLQTANLFIVSAPGLATCTERCLRGGAGGCLGNEASIQYLQQLPVKNTGDLEIVRLSQKSIVHAYKEAGENPV